MTQRLIKCWERECFNLNLKEKPSVITVAINKKNIIHCLHQLFHMTLVNAFNCFQCESSLCLIKYKFSTLPNSPVMAPHSHPIFVFHFHNPRENFIQTLTNSKYITKYISHPPAHKIDHQTSHLKFNISLFSQTVKIWSHGKSLFPKPFFLCNSITEFPNFYFSSQYLQISQSTKVWPI